MPKGQSSNFCEECQKTVHSTKYRKIKGMCRWCFDELLRINRYLYGIPTDEDTARLNKVREELKWQSIIHRQYE